MFVQAMELILTGDVLSADEAEKAGLVAKVFPDAEVLKQAIDLGERDVVVGNTD